MNAERFMELLNTLPDEMLVSAAQAAPKRNRKPIIYLISAAAACLVVGLTAAIYPKLRTQTPEIVPSGISSETTAQTESTTTSASSAAQTTTTSTVLTATAAQPQTVSTAESSVSSMTSAQSESAAETVSEQTATTEQTIQTTLTTASATATQSRLSTTTTAATTVRTTISTISDATTTTADEHKVEVPEQKESIPTQSEAFWCEKTKLNVSLSPGPTDIYTEQCTFLLDNMIPESIVPVERTYDDLYVTVFTCNKDISITGGVLDTEAENLVLTADCLLTTDGDFTLRGYKFLIQLPHSILNSNPSCQMQFRYQNELDYISQTGDTIPVQIIGAMP